MLTAAVSFAILGGAAAAAASIVSKRLDSIAESQTAAFAAGLGGVPSELPGEAPAADHVSATAAEGEE